MKIAIMDPYLRKFTGDMVDWWQAHGHEVRIDRYWHPENALWADVVWFDTADNNIASATNPSVAIMDDSSNFQPWDLHDMDLTNKQIIVRALDIEIWQGHQMNAIWDVVDDVVFIAPHIRRLATDFPGGNPRVHTIPCGIDMSKYRFEQREASKDIAIVSEKWTSKGTDLILQVAAKLPGYKFHWLGRWSDHPWEIRYFEDFIERLGLEFYFTDWLDADNAVDEFLEGKSHLLHASHKEGFSYIIAEAMAKGLRPVPHHFYGAGEIWPEITWNTIDEAVNMITDPFVNSLGYRQYLTDQGYTIDDMMSKISKVIEGGKNES